MRDASLGQREPAMHEFMTIVRDRGSRAGRLIRVSRLDLDGIAVRRNRRRSPRRGRGLPKGAAR